MQYNPNEMAVAREYVSMVAYRIRILGASPARSRDALKLLVAIVRNLPKQSYECTKTAKELSSITEINPAQISSLLLLLEQAEAIKRVKRGRSKIIIITPADEFREAVNKHAEKTKKHRFEVIEGGREPKQTDLEDSTGKPNQPKR